jgi:hypothetical protein
VLRINAIIFALLLIVFTLPFELLADFQFDLAIAGRGRVLVTPGGPPTEYTSTPPSSLQVTGDQAVVVAIPETFDADQPPDITIGAGSDLVITLTNTVLGSKFIEWTGSALSSTNPSDSDYQDPTSNAYTVFKPANPADVKNIQANFSSAIAEVGIDTVSFTIDGQSTSAPVSLWNFTGDDDPLNPSFMGETIIQINWSSLAGQIAIGETKLFNVNIVDKTGNNFLAGFDVTVSSTAVPEPSSFVLLSVAAAGYFGIRRRKRKIRTQEATVTLNQ